jgi:RpiR family transcriptional regulator, carbohydrate utilization regulator
MTLTAQDIDDNLLEVIARGLDSLRKSDRKVAEAILADPPRAVELTLAELSRLAQVSEPTVIRFATAIGCDGFRDMRMRLARSLAFARTTSHAAISPSDNLATLMTKIFDFNLANLNWARGRLDPEAIAQAVAAMVAAPRIEFFGLGASAIVALDAQQKFPLFGVPCGAQTDSHQMFMTAALLSPGDVAVAISNTGQTREVVQTVRLARERGAVTIGITGSDSPMAALCNISIVAETLENTDIYTPTVSRLSAMVVIDILSTAVSLARDEAHRARVAEMKRQLAEVRTSGRY